MKLIEVRSKKDLKNFIELPWKIYKNYPHWVPPLKKEVAGTLSREKNPFFRHSEAAYFIVKEKNEILGRIAAIQNKNHNSYHNDKVGFFGFFETVENYKATELLFNKAKEWCKERGLNILRGPTSFSMNDQCGLLIEGFDKDPSFMMPYNPEYYINLFEKYGFKKSKDLFAYTKTTGNPSERILKLLDRIKKKKDISIRNIRMNEFKKELISINDIYNSAWEKNWGFVAMTKEEIGLTAKKLKPLIDPRGVYLAEIMGKPVAFALMMWDYNQIIKSFNGKFGLIEMIKLLSYKNKSGNTARFMALGTKKKYCNLGIGLLLCHKALETGRKVGMRRKMNTSAELSWILEDNYLMNNTIKEMGGALYKKYRLYETSITLR